MDFIPSAYASGADMIDETHRRGRLLAGGGVDYSKPARDEYPPTPRRSTNMPTTSANKAVLAAVLAALVSLVTALQDKTSLDSLNALGWVLVVLSAIVTGLTVYVVPNRPTR